MGWKSWPERAFSPCGHPVKLMGKRMDRDGSKEVIKLEFSVRSCTDDICGLERGLDGFTEFISGSTVTEGNLHSQSEK